MPDDNSDPREAGEDQAKPTSLEPAGQTRTPESDLESLLAENADMRDRLLRTMADMENLRRRTEREKEDTARYAISNFARDVLTLGDNLRRVIEHVPADAAELRSHHSHGGLHRTTARTAGAANALSP